MKIIYPPPYERTNLRYKHANIDFISKAIYSFDWKEAFEGCDQNKKVDILNDTGVDTISKSISNEIILIDDRYPPLIS